MNKKLICECCGIETNSGVIKVSQSNPKDSHVYCLDCFDAGLEPYSTLVEMCAKDGKSFMELTPSTQAYMVTNLLFHKKSISEFDADIETYRKTHNINIEEILKFDLDVLKVGCAIKCEIKGKIINAIITQATETELKLLVAGEDKPENAKIHTVTIPMIKEQKYKLLLLIANEQEDICISDTKTSFITLKNSESDVEEWDEEILNFDDGITQMNRETLKGLMDMCKEVIDSKIGEQLDKKGENQANNNAPVQEPKKEEPKTKRMCDVIAERNGWTVNPEESVTESILRGLTSNREMFGAMFCPCEIVHTKDTICPCKTFREEVVEGACHCGLYLKPSKPKQEPQFKVGDVVALQGNDLKLPTAYLNTCGTVEKVTETSVTVKFDPRAISEEEYIGTHLVVAPFNLVKLNK